MPTITFERVRLQSRKTGKCQHCGKKRARSTTFEQTINPFNKNASGLPKTRQEIYAELSADAQKWKAEPIDCCTPV